MQIQKEASSDNLLSKRADTENGSRQMQISDMSWSFRPSVKYRTKDKQTRNVPTLDGIAKAVLENGSFPDDVTNNEFENQDNIEDISQTDRLISLYHNLLRYSFSKDYVQKSTPNDSYSKEVELQPYLFIKLGSNVGDEVYASLKNPFRNKAIKNLLSVAKTDQNVDLMYESDNPVLVVNEQKYELSHARLVQDNKSLEVKIMEALSERSDVEHMVMSDYDGWSEISVDTVRNEDTKTIIETEGDNLNWVFDEPIVWDEEQENVVKLLENFANGDKQQLDNIYIRPTNPVVDDYTETKTHSDTNWDIALEEPEQEPEDGSFALKVFIIVQMILIGTIFISALIALLLI